MSNAAILPRAAALFSRRVCNDYNYGYGYNYSYNCHSAWYRWGRWVLAGILIFIGIVLILGFAFCASRRRRRSRYQTTTTPMTTQPAAGGYDMNYNNYAPPAGAPPTYAGNYEAGNQGYYGQQGGVTQPQNAYVK